MKTLEFKIQINATPQKVWKALLDEESYKQWTNHFCEGSYYKTTNLTQGNKIQFLMPDGQGMYSVIDKMDVNKTIAFRHLGDIKNFVELPIDAKTEVWTNAMETYSLTANQWGTELTATVEIIEPHAEFMNKTFPLALQELKNISEQ